MIQQISKAFVFQQLILTALPLAMPALTSLVGNWKHQVDSEQSNSKSNQEST